MNNFDHSTAANWNGLAAASTYSSSSNRRGRSQLSAIIIPHQGPTGGSLTTSYAPEEYGMDDSTEQRRQRERFLALAKAEAVTSRFSHLCDVSMRHLPVHNHRLESSSAASVASYQSRSSRRASVEPENLHTHKALRKGSTMSSSSTTTTDSVAAAAPPPPPLTTEVTDFLLSRKGHMQEETDPPDWTAHVTDRISNQSNSGRQQRRVSAPTMVMDQEKMPPRASTPPTDYRHRPSFQAANPPSTRSYSYSDSSTDEASSFYQAIVLEQQRQWHESTSSRSSLDNNPNRLGKNVEETADSSRSLLSAFSEDEQARFLRQFSREDLSTLKPSARSSFIVEQEQQEVPYAAQKPMSPLEEQAMLWEQIRNSMNRKDDPMPWTGSPDSVLSLSSQVPIVGPIEEQTLLLGQFQRYRPFSLADETRSPFSLADETRSSSSNNNDRHDSSKPKAWSAIEEQAQRFREIQEDKERQIVEMACKLSMDGSAPSVTGSSFSSSVEDVEQDEELSLQYIMDMSRQEAESRTKADIEVEKALQIALERSREDLLEEEIKEVSKAESFNLELRQSIAELACQTSLDDQGIRHSTSQRGSSACEGESF